MSLEPVATKPGCCEGHGSGHHEGDCPMSAAPGAAPASKCPYRSGRAATGTTR